MANAVLNQLQECAAAMREHERQGKSLLRRRNRLFAKALREGVPATEAGAPFGLKGQSVRWNADRPVTTASQSEAQAARARKPRRSRTAPVAVAAVEAE